MTALDHDTAAFTVPADAKDYVLCGADAAMTEVRKAAGDGSIGVINKT